jgi:ATP-dependent exoDNAse (exonuclease V) alpha subunit
MNWFWPMLSIHKSQGSESPAVVIPLTTQHYTMLARNLLYTGVTCGKKLVVLLGTCNYFKQVKACGLLSRRSHIQSRRQHIGSYQRHRSLR